MRRISNVLVVMALTVIPSMAAKGPTEARHVGLATSSSASGSSSGAISSAATSFNSTVNSGCSLGIAPTSASGPGYWMVDGLGNVYNCGSAQVYGSANSLGSATAIASTPTGGYWVANSLGFVQGFGNAQTYRLSGTPISGTSVVSIASTHDGKGYWMATNLGQIITAGDAVNYGSPQESNLTLAGTIVNMVATSDGQGYWLLGSDGGVFSYGDAKFYGSPGQINPGLAPGGTNSVEPLNAPAVAIAPSATGKGYWFVAADGGVFAFGDAQFYGSTGQINPGLASGGTNSVISSLVKPIIGMVVTPSGSGYWMVASDGGVFAFGDAQFVGSLGSTPLVSPIVGFAPAPMLANQPATGSISLMTEPAAGYSWVNSAISGARSTLELVMYELSDTTIEGDLVAAAARGVSVKVLLDQHFEQSANQAAYNYLSANGVMVAWANQSTTFHQKTLCVDGSTCWIMTGNFTPQYYSTSRDFVVVDTQPDDVAAITSTFLSDFGGGLPTSAPSGNDLLWSPGSEPATVALINSAKQSLLIENA